MLRHAQEKIESCAIGANRHPGIDTGVIMVQSRSGSGQCNDGGDTSMKRSDILFLIICK